MNRQRMLELGQQVRGVPLFENLEVYSLDRSRIRDWRAFESGTVYFERLRTA